MSVFSLAEHQAMSGSGSASPEVEPMETEEEARAKKDRLREVEPMETEEEARAKKDKLREEQRQKRKAVSKLLRLNIPWRLYTGSLWFVCAVSFGVHRMAHTNHKFPTYTAQQKCLNATEKLAVQYGGVH